MSDLPLCRVCGKPSSRHVTHGLHTAKLIAKNGWYCPQHDASNVSKEDLRKREKEVREWL